MADAYRTQLQDSAIGSLSFDQRVGLLGAEVRFDAAQREVHRAARDPSSAVSYMTAT